MLLVVFIGTFHFSFWLKLKTTTIYELPRFHGLTGLGSAPCWPGQQSYRISAGLGYPTWLTPMAAPYGDTLARALGHWDTGFLSFHVSLVLSTCLLRVVCPGGIFDGAGRPGTGFISSLPPGYMYSSPIPVLPRRL